MTEYQIHTFSNGIRWVHKPVTNTQIAHCGFILDIGSRDESPDQMGLAHFWEHMAFKGTKKRKAFHIINRLENIGGELNAYTTKEKICFYASILDKHFERAVDLLSDITFQSIFPEKQIEREKGVILEEMSMYLDSPEDAIQDEFDALIFGENHPLGYNILGTQESVEGFKKADFEQFLVENMNTDRIIFSTVGNISYKKAFKIVEKYLKDIPTIKAKHYRKPFETPKNELTLIKKSPITQAHCAIGGEAYSLSEDIRLAFFLLNNILGGPAMGSRLNLSMRERKGLVYSVESVYTPYTDTGMWGIFFGTEKKQLGKALDIVHKELKLLQNTVLGNVQLHNAKEQLMGQLAMSDENNLSFMLMMGKSLLDTEKIENLEDIFAEIKAIKAVDLQEIAQEIYQMDKLKTLQYIPE